MKVWRLGSCENFVGKREELVFDEFSDLERWGRSLDDTCSESYTFIPRLS